MATTDTRFTLLAKKKENLDPRQVANQSFEVKFKSFRYMNKITIATRKRNMPAVLIQAQEYLKE